MSRFIRKVRKAKWYTSSDVQWLGHGELQADALFDFETKHNEVSVWKLEDDNSNLERVIASLASTRDQLSNLDYAIIEQSKLDEIGIDMKPSDGVSADEEANQKWHRDLVELTAEKIYLLARSVQLAQIERVSLSDVRESLSRGLSHGWICRGRLKCKVRKKLGVK